MSTFDNLEGVNLEELRIRLNRNPNLFSQYPKLRIGETVTNEELSEMLSRIIGQLNLNPTLKDVDISLPDLRDSNLSGANLNGMDFSGKMMSYSKFKCCDLVGTKFNNVIAISAEFLFSDLTGAEFIDAELSETSFQKTNLTGANFSGATMNDISLDDADMTRANISNASLIGGEFPGTNMQDIIYNNLTDTPSLHEAINVPQGLIDMEHDDDEGDFDDDEYFPINDPIHGVAFEIHNVFNKIDIDKYHEILKKSVAAIRKGGPRGNWDLPVIKHSFEHIIDQDFPKNDTEQARAKTKLNAINNLLQNSGELRQDNVMKLVSDTAQFVFEQKSSEFKVFYITSFIQDCYHAYSQPTGLPFEDERGMSCVKGIVERFIWIIGDTVQAMCTNAKKCKPLYKELLDVFGKNKLDINELTQQWNTEVLETDAFQDKTNMTKEQVKKNYIDFMKSKYSTVGLWIPSTQERVEKRANELDYAFEGRMFGGNRRAKTNKNKKTLKKNKKNKTVHKKEPKNHTRNKKSKKYTIKRRK